MRAERLAAPPPERLSADLLALKAAGDAEQGGKQCDAPRNTGWRPGARWAREEVARQVAALPAHQRPPLRELGRRSEAAAPPYRRLPGDDSGKASGWPEPGWAPATIETAGSGAGDRARRAGNAALTAGKRAGPGRTPGDGTHPAAPDTVPANRHAHADDMPISGNPLPGTPLPDPQSGSRNAGATVRERVAALTGDTATSVRPDPADRAGAALAPPLVAVERIGSRVVVAAASPAARALGIAPGMALTQARALVPDLLVHSADVAGDRAALHRLAVALARHWCPVVTVSDDDGLLLDITGVAHLHGGEQAMARRIVRLLARLGHQARIAIADTAGAAWALARHAATRVTRLPPGDPLPALAGLPATALRLDATTVETMRRLGLETIGDLAALPRAPLVRRFGAAVAVRLDALRGHAAEPLAPVAVPEPVTVERRFAEPLLTAAPIAHWLGMLVDTLSVRLAERGLGARAILLAAIRVDRQAQVVRIGLARPTRDPAHLRRLLLRRIETIEPGYGIEALTLHVRRADPLSAEAVAGALAGEEAPDLAPLVDAIVNRIGVRRLWRAIPCDSDVPERSIAATNPLDPPDSSMPVLAPDDVRRLDERAADHAWHPRWPRPVRLLRRPEPVDHVIAELPDQPPRRFTWRGRTHRIVRGDGPERIAGEWWHRPREDAAVRDYFRVEDEDGRRFWLFRRGDGEYAPSGDLSWHIHGTFG